MEQGSQARTGCRTSLANGTKYFDTGQYRCTVSDLPLLYIYKQNLYYLLKSLNL